MNIPPTNDTNETVIEEFLEGEPRAAYWRELREALQDRLKDAIAARDTALNDPGISTKQREDREARVLALREQVYALASEEAITGFVENSVRQSLTRPRQARDFDAEFGDEFGEDDDTGASY